MDMTTDYIANLDATMVALIVVVAFTSKLGGVLIGARLGGMPVDRDTWAIGSAWTRGAA